jgi:hypothetical protein
LNIELIKEEEIQEGVGHPNKVLITDITVQYKTYKKKNGNELNK